MIKRFHNLFFVKNILLGGIVFLFVVAVVTWGLLFFDNNRVFARFSLAGELLAMEEQLQLDIATLETFEPPVEEIVPLRERFAAFRTHRAKEFYSEDLFEEMLSLYEAMQILTEEYQTTWKDSIIAVQQENQAKLQELERYQLRTTEQREDYEHLASELDKAQTQTDFRKVLAEANTLGIFLQDIIDTNKTLYLKEHLNEEIVAIEDLLLRGQGVGLEDEDLENAIEQLKNLHIVDSKDYLFQVKKYERLLVDRKLAFQQQLDEKMTTLQEQQQRSGYIAVKPPTKPLPGKSIEVSVGEQVMRLYEDGEQIFSTFVVTGKNGWWTTKGHHHIFHKQRNKILDGRSVGEDYRVPVRYWMPFTSSGEGIHDISTRRVFGPAAGRAWNGSHGCVNTPMAAVKYIYYWAEVGTPVIVY